MALEEVEVLDRLRTAMGDDHSIAALDRAFRQLSLTIHPDKGGNTEGFQLLENAKTILTAEINASLSRPIGFMDRNHWANQAGEWDSEAGEWQTRGADFPPKGVPPKVR